MDSKTVELLKMVATKNTPEFLSALSTIGEYKRALKEFDSREYSYSTQGQTVTISFLDAVVSLTPHGQSCTCPSPVVCRHILMAFMVVDKICKQQQQVNNPCNLADTQQNEQKLKANNPFAFINNITREQIEEIFSAKTMFRAEERFDSSEIRQTISDVLNIYVNGCNVVFLPYGTVKQAICSCKKAECEHKCLALLYLYYKNGGQLTTSKDYTFTTNENERLKECLRFFGNVFAKGAYGCNSSDVDSASFYALNMLMLSSPLGSYIKSFAKVLNGFVENNVYADESDYCYYYCKSVNLLSILINNYQNNIVLSKVTNNTKNTYYPKARGEFLSLGIHPFISNSGYAGAVHLIYSLDINEICSFSEVLPSIYDKSAKEIIFRALNSLSIMPTAQGKRFFLNNYKQSANLKITSSDQTLASEIKSFSFADIAMYSNIITDYESITFKKVVDYFELDSESRFKIIFYDSLFVDGYNLDEGEMWIVLKKSDFKLSVFLPYNEGTESAINVLEGMQFFNGFVVVSTEGTNYKLLTLFDENGLVPMYSFKKGEQ